MAVAIKQSVTPAYLLQQSQWAPQGWSVIKRAVLKPVLLDPAAPRAVPAALEAFEWTDIQVFGIGNADDGIRRLNDAIAQRGGTLYAYGLFRRQVFNALGVSIWSYRLVLLHNPVFLELAGWAVLILASVFAAVIFLQYVTTGRAPALDDLKNLWGSGVSQLGGAIGTAAGGAAQPFVWLFLAAGAASIAFALASKEAGVRAKPPSASVGIKGGPVSTRVSS